MISTLETQTILRNLLTTRIHCTAFQTYYIGLFRKTKPSKCKPPHCNPAECLHCNLGPEAFPGIIGLCTKTACSPHSSKTAMHVYDSTDRCLFDTTATIRKKHRSGILPQEKTSRQVKYNEAGLWLWYFCNNARRGKPNATTNFKPHVVQFNDSLRS